MDQGLAQDGHAHQRLPLNWLYSPLRLHYTRSQVNEYGRSHRKAFRKGVVIRASGVRPLDEAKRFDES